MNLTELTEVIIKSIVKFEDDVEIKEIDTDTDEVEISVKVNDADMGRLIGKSGKIINSIRVLIQEASSLRDNKYVKIEVEKI